MKNKITIPTTPFSTYSERVLQIDAQSGCMHLDLGETQMRISLQSIQEIDANGKPVGNTVSEFKNFTIAPLQRDAPILCAPSKGHIVPIRRRGTANGSISSFYTILPNKAKLKIDAIVVTQGGKGGTVDDSVRMRPRDFKFNIELLDWKWAENNPGASVDINMEFKTNGSAIYPNDFIKNKYHVSGTNISLHIPNQYYAYDDELDEVKLRTMGDSTQFESDYPKLSGSNSGNDGQVFTCRFSKSSRIFYDPSTIYENMATAFYLVIKFCCLITGALQIANLVLFYAPDVHLCDAISSVFVTNPNKHETNAFERILVENNKALFNEPVSSYRDGGAPYKQVPGASNDDIVYKVFYGLTVFCALQMSVILYFFYLSDHRRYDQNGSQLNPDPQTINVAPPNINGDDPDLVDDDDPDINIDAFLTHTWNFDEVGRDTHARVKAFNEALQRRGIRTWFDDDRMRGNIYNQMTRGIDHSATMVVFITKKYVEKVAGRGPNGNNDNCKFEFEYGLNHKTVDNMIPVVMETRLPRNWKGSVGFLQSQFYYNYKEDNELDQCVQNVINEVRKRINQMPNSNV